MCYCLSRTTLQEIHGTLVAQDVISTSYYALIVHNIFLPILWYGCELELEDLSVYSTKQLVYHIPGSIKGATISDWACPTLW